MTDIAPRHFVRALQDLPTGTSKGRFGDRSYVASKTVYNDGKSIKFVAEELGGRDYVSLNLYQLAGGFSLKPCEMSCEKVIDFVTRFSATKGDAF